MFLNDNIYSRYHSKIIKVRPIKFLSFPSIPATYFLFTDANYVARFFDNVPEDVCITPSFSTNLSIPNMYRTFKNGIYLTYHYMWIQTKLPHYFSSQLHICFFFNFSNIYCTALYHNFINLPMTLGVLSTFCDWDILLPLVLKFRSLVLFSKFLSKWLLSVMNIMMS